MGRPALTDDDFRARVRIGKETECWPWMGPIHQLNGHGLFRNKAAHRHAWLLHSGQKIPPGLQIGHTCNDLSCCNPRHLIMGRRSDIAKKMTDADFWASVDVRESNECWVWKGPRDKFGYGRFSKERTHRYSWKTHNKQDVAPDMCVCHRCDNPPCVNPRHLFLGTRADNNMDRTMKGRTVTNNGVANGNSKLTETDVIAILNAWIAGESPYAIAPRFGVHMTLVHQIVAGKIWTHVPGMPGAPTLDQIRSRGPVVRWNSTLDAETAVAIMKRLVTGENGNAIAREFGVSQNTIFKIRHGKSWAHLTGKNGVPTLDQMQAAMRR